MSLRNLSPRLAGCCALLVFATSVWPQSPSASRSSLPVDTRDSVRPMLPAQLQDFGAYVDTARKTFDVPGIAVAIVKDGKVV
ncbi:MAG: serine hydrolase, partial [Rhodanobacter sp.]